MLSSFFPSHLLSYQREESYHYNLHFNSESYPRGNVNKERRTDYNDILVHVHNEALTLKPDEGHVQQRYRLEFYEGSTYIGEKGFSEPEKNQTDITIITQTSY